MARRSENSEVSPRKKIKQSNSDSEKGKNKDLDDRINDGDSQMEWRQKVKGVLEINGYVLENKVLSDVTFEVGPEKIEFSAHRLILAFASPVFEAMFYGPLAEKGEKVVIPDIAPEGFQVLLKYIYTGSVSFENENDAFKASTAAEKYCIPNLKEECEKHINRCPLKPQNIWILLENALFMGMNTISKRCEEYLKKNTFLALEVDNFVETSSETVEIILKMDSLNVKELTLLESVVRWAEHKSGPEKDKNSTKELLRPLLKHIRFGVLTAPEFCSFLEKEQHLLSDADALAILKNLVQPLSYALPEWCCQKLWRNNSHCSDQSPDSGSRSPSSYIEMTLKEIRRKYKRKNFSSSCSTSSSSDDDDASSSSSSSSGY